jgi:hypothetical protein
MNLDEKIQLVSFRVKKMNKKLKCCSCLFACYAIFFFMSAMNTIFSARFNASFIAQTGELPWGNMNAKDFIPSEEPAAGEFSLYNSFFKMAAAMLFLSFVMVNFIMRTAIARWCQNDKNSRIAFRRTFYCIFFFFLGWYFVSAECKEFMGMHATIAEMKNITVPEFEGRVLRSTITKSNNFEDFLKHFNMTSE